MSNDETQASPLSSYDNSHKSTTPSINPMMDANKLPLFHILEEGDGNIAFEIDLFGAMDLEDEYG